MYLYTIGYQGLDQTEVIHRLCQVGIQHVIDVRELPLSRKPGLSKTALRAELADHGIDYSHVRALGCPRDIRHDYRDDRRWDRYRSRFLDHLVQQSAALDDLVWFAHRQKTCLLCFEADAERCHRSLIAEQIRHQMGVNLILQHLVGATSSNPDQVAPLDVAAL